FGLVASAVIAQAAGRVANAGGSVLAVRRFVHAAGRGVNTGTDASRTHDPLLELPCAVRRSLVDYCRPVRTWRNWQTRYFEVVVPQGMQVQVLPCAPTPLRFRGSRRLGRACFAAPLPASSRRRAANAVART